MKNTPPAPYTLASGDMGALANLLTIQGNISANPLTQDNLLTLMAQLNNLSENYPNMHNPSLKNWVDTLFNNLIHIETVYKQQFPALYIAYNVYIYTKGDREAWYQTGVGYAWPNFMGMNVNSGIPMWNPPKNSLSWNKSITSLPWFSENKAPPLNIILYSMDYDTLLANSKAIFDPTKWTDATQIPVKCAPVWSAEFQILQALTKLTELTTDDCLFVLNLMVALCSSANSTHINLVNKIANTICSSTENPNSTLANQLSYYSLMYQANPLGTFVWTNTQLQTGTQNMIDAITTSNPASQIMKKTLSTQWKILHAAASYPMSDPYNPTIGFNVRMTDTLAAINKAWPSLN